MSKPMNVASGHIHLTGDVEVGDLIPFFGLCCFITSCYTDFPACLGAGCENTVLCLKNKSILCKKSEEPDAYCKCCLIDCDVVPTKVCLESRTQLCCIDLRSAIPCSENIPCLVTVCFVTCCYKYGCLCRACTEIKNYPAEAQVSS